MKNGKNLDKVDKEGQQSWEGISLACLGTWGDQIETIRECIGKVGTRARPARLSGDGLLCANWVLLGANTCCLLPGDLIEYLLMLDIFLLVEP